MQASAKRLELLLYWDEDEGKAARTVDSSRGGREDDSSSSLVVILHCHCWCTEVIDEEINDQKSVSVHPLGEGRHFDFSLGVMIFSAAHVRVVPSLF